MNIQISDPLELGAWIGRSQAFGMLASQSSVAQAQSLRRIRDARAYQLLHLTWEQFCHDHAGISRPRADALIHKLEEFGETYFRLSEITHLSPTAYRKLAPRVHGEQLEIDSELVDITPANAVRIRTAVTSMRLELKHAKDLADRAAMPAIAELHNRLDECFHKIAALAECELSETEASGLRGLLNFATHALQRVARQLA